MKVTLHEVAAHANVSIATVSRALNGLPVSEKSKARVDKAVAELGYVANEAARALRTDRTMTMGLIFYDLRNLLGIDLLDALSESIEDAGYSLLICTARGDAQRYDVLMRRFLERRVDALFCIRPRGEGASLAQYHSAGIPALALFSASGGFADLPLLVPAFDEASSDLYGHLHDLGHRRVAVLDEPTPRPPVAAIARALKAQGLHVEHAPIGEGSGMREALDRLMSKKQRPTVFVAPDPAARGLLAACHSAGLKVPRDVSVVSSCDIAAESHNKKHAISSFVVDAHRTGRGCGGAMLAWLSGARPADRIRIQVASFAPRASSGPAP